MDKPHTYEGFDWVDPPPIDITQILDNLEVGYILKIDLDYPSMIKEC